jgi:hypothetical protein
MLWPHILQDLKTQNLSFYLVSGCGGSKSNGGDAPFKPLDRLHGRYGLHH